MNKELLLQMIKKNPHGVSAGDLEKAIGVSRATVNRLLKDVIQENKVKSEGNGPSRIYKELDPFDSVFRYFEAPFSERKLARFEESRLDTVPAISSSIIEGISQFKPLTRRDLVNFLVDFSCGSSILEGGSYSLLDTKALIEYGEKHPDKPKSDQALVLNHKEAFETLFEHPSFESLTDIHKRLVNAHEIPELLDSPHFLPAEQCGLVREYEEINIGQSAYAPPFYPGTGKIKIWLNQILSKAESMADPITAAVYLLSRLPYLQPFIDGNKRTSRVICNVPLLKAGLPPISFMDFNKKEYLTSMLAFYELGDTQLLEKCFAEAYLKSCQRLGLDRKLSGRTLVELKDARAHRALEQGQARPASEFKF